MTETLHDLARWLYRPLHAENDHLTWDDPIEERIIVNEYTAPKEGAGSGDWKVDDRFI